MENSLKVFGNELVWRVLGPYLGNSDLKDCRLVCKTFEENVTNLRRWKEKLQVHLKKETWATPQFHSFVFESPNFDCDTIKVTLSAFGPQETEEIHDVSNIFKNVKSLTLQFDQGTGENFHVGGLSETLRSILRNCSGKLENLEIDEDFLAAFDFSPLFDCPTIADRINGVKALKVFQKSRKEKAGKEGVVKIVTKGSPPTWFTTANVKDSLNILAKHLTSVEALSLPKTQEDLPSEMIQLIKQRASSLKTLELGTIDAVTSFASCTFPNLTHLSLRTSDDLKPRTFLSNQPDLESLTLKVRGLISPRLLGIIKEKLTNCVKLGLKCWEWDEDNDLSFLKDLEKLREFSFMIPPSSSDGMDSCFIEDILNSLPQGMTKIYLRSGYANFLTTEDDMDTCIRSCKFKDLEELSILFVEEALDDDFFQFIGTRGENGAFPFPKLRKFHFSHPLLDEELPGDKAFWDGLQDVGIRKVSELLFENSLIEKLSGTNIRHLSLREIPMLESDVQQIMSNNKFLETFTSSHFDMKPCNPRVKSVVCIPDYEDGDSDSDVEPGFQNEEFFEEYHEIKDGADWYDYDSDY